MVKAVSRPKVHSELKDAVPDRLAVAHVSALNTVKAALNTLFGLRVFDASDPVLNRTGAVFKNKCF